MLSLCFKGTSIGNVIILACQNDDMLSEAELLCSEIQEAFEKEAL